MGIGIKGSTTLDVSVGRRLKLNAVQRDLEETV